MSNYTIVLKNWIISNFEIINFGWVTMELKNKNLKLDIDWDHSSWIANYEELKIDPTKNSPKERIFEKALEKQEIQSIKVHDNKLYLIGENFVFTLFPDGENIQKFQKKYKKPLLSFMIGIWWFGIDVDFMIHAYPKNQGHDDNLDIFISSDELERILNS